jgi:DNA repair protein RadC
MMELQTMLTSNTTHVPLYVRETGRRYRPATTDEIKAASGAIGYRAIVGNTLSSPRVVREFLSERFAGLDYEVFGAILLDNRHRVLAVEEVFRGTLDGASVHPRDMVRLVLDRGAAAVVLFHNHPSGIAEPSQADEMITGRLRDALALIDVRVLDHVIVGAGTPVSFAERGLL